MENLRPVGDAPTSREELHELLQRAREGCREAIAALFTNHTGDWLTVLGRKFQQLRVLRRLYDPDDFRQHVALRLLTHVFPVTVFDSASSFVACVKAMAHRHVCDLWRHHLHTTRFNLNREVALDSPCVRPDHDLVARGPGAADLCLDDTVWEGLVNGLEAAEEVMLLALRQGYTPREVGAQLGVSVRTVERFRAMLAAKARRQVAALT